MKRVIQAFALFLCALFAAGLRRSRACMISMVCAFTNDG